MKGCPTALMVLAWLSAAVMAPAIAQTFQSYRCEDNTQFVAGFFDRDTRAHLQIDGKAVALRRRIAFSGARYSGGGISLKISRNGVASLRHASRPVTRCELS